MLIAFEVPVYYIEIRPLYCSIFEPEAAPDHHRYISAFVVGCNKTWFPFILWAPKAPFLLFSLTPLCRTLITPHVCIEVFFCLILSKYSPSKPFSCYNCCKFWSLLCKLGCDTVLSKDSLDSRVRDFEATCLFDSTILCFPVRSNKP
jgi:hypothetical protein